MSRLRKNIAFIEKKQNINIQLNIYISSLLLKLLNIKYF